MPPPMAIFPLYNDRLGDDLSIDGGVCLKRCLECLFQRLWWLSRAWAAQSSILAAREGSNDYDLTGFCRSSDYLSNG